MSELNQQSFSTGKKDSATAHLQRSPQPPIPQPIWRFRPALKRVGVVKTIKTQIIPKIVLALRKFPPTAKIEQAEANPVEQFAALVLANDDSAAFAYIEDLLAQGASVESIFLDLLGPAARQLGTQWEADVTDFASVTLGVSRLQRIMRMLGEYFFNEANLGTGGESILLTTIPGEQHSFGLSMVAEFFRRAGWNLAAGPFSSNQELTSLIHNHWFDVIGFSVSSERRLGDLEKQIGDIRRESRNKHIGIMLGGPMTMTHRELVASMGADMISTDASTAPQQARDLVERMKQQS